MAIGVCFMVMINECLIVLIELINSGQEWFPLIVNDGRWSCFDNANVLAATFCLLCLINRINTIVFMIKLIFIPLAKIG